MEGRERGRTGADAEKESNKETRGTRRAVMHRTISELEILVTSVRLFCFWSSVNSCIVIFLCCCGGCSIQRV